MLPDKCENLNRYFASSFKSDGVYYKPDDIQVIIQVHDLETLTALARIKIDKLKESIGNAKIGVSNWFSLSDIGGIYILSMTYRVM